MKLITKEYLKREYLDNKRTITDIAKEHHTCRKRISKLLKIYGIKIRSIPESNRLYFSNGGKHGMKGRKHTEKTKKVMSEKKNGYIPWNKGKKYPQIAGKNSHFWKGGVTALDDQIRKSREYAKWRFNIFKRDNFTCQFCKKNRIYLIVHHLKPFSDIIEENKIKTFEQALNCAELWYIENGIALCKKCHKQIHWGKKNESNNNHSK